MGRLVILWTRPYHLSAEEADAWSRREAKRLARLEGVDWGELTRVRSPSLHYPNEWDWMLELHLHAGVDPQECADMQECGDWVRDLRLLGMRPTVVVVEHSTSLDEKAR
jgi:hypothetical protein